MSTLEHVSPSQYQQQGYLVLPHYLGFTDLELLRDVCDSLLKEPPDDDKGGEAHNIGRGHDRRFLRHRHADTPELANFVLGRQMEQLASTLLGRSPYLFNEQFVVKGPRTGASFAWHQDSAYVGFDHEPYLSIWIALDDTHSKNGPVYLQARDLNEDEGIVEHTWDDTGKELVGYSGGDPGIAAIVPAGSVVAFSSLTLHRSSPNVTDKPRRAYLAQFSPAPIIDPTTSAPKIFATPLSKR